MREVEGIRGFIYLNFSGWSAASSCGMKVVRSIAIFLFAKKCTKKSHQYRSVWFKEVFPPYLAVNRRWHLAIDECYDGIEFWHLNTVKAQITLSLVIFDL